MESVVHIAKAIPWIMRMTIENVMLFERQYRIMQQATTPYEMIIIFFLLNLSDAAPEKGLNTRAT